jgi:CBS domain-containing protein
MNDILERLMALRVADVMTRELVQISANQSMSEVAKVFAERTVSAAPVLDEEGRCVGVLSAADFVRRERDSGTAAPLAMEEHTLAPKRAGEPLRIDPTARNLVAHYMSRSVQSIQPGASLVSAARMMSTEHIHRLPVIGDDGRPEGMISTMDIVAAVVNLVDELKSLRK